MSSNNIVTQEEYDLLNRLYLDHKHKYETSNYVYSILKKEYDELEQEYNKLFQFLFHSNTQFDETNKVIFENIDELCKATDIDKVLKNYDIIFDEIF